MKSPLLLLIFCGLAARVSAAAFTVGGFTWDSDNAVTSAAFTEGGPGSLLASSFPEGSRSIGSLLGGPNPGFVDITGGVNNTARHTLTMNWSAAPGGALLSNQPGQDLLIYEVGSAGLPEAYAVSVRNAATGISTPFHYFFSDSFDTPAAAFATAIDLSDFGGGINFIDQVSVRSIFNSAGPNGGDRVDLAGGSGEGPVTFDVGAGNFLNRLLEGGPQSTIIGEYAASRLDADIVYVVGMHNTVPEPGAVLLLAACLPGVLRRRR